MGGVCCARRENEHDFMENGVEGNCHSFLITLQLSFSPTREISSSKKSSKLSTRNTCTMRCYSTRMCLISIHTSR